MTNSRGRTTTENIHELTGKQTIDKRDPKEI